MRTTIDLPDAVFRRAKARAAMEGVTLKELITRCVEQGLRRRMDASEEPADRRRSELPVARPATGRTLPARTGADLQRILDEETAGGRVD